MKNFSEKIKFRKIELFVLTFIFIVLLPPLDSQALIYDDLNAFFENPLFNPISWKSFFSLIFVPQKGVLYSPVTYVYWSLLAGFFQLFGINLAQSKSVVLILKFLSIALHLIGVKIIWNLLKVILNENKYQISILIGVLVYATHPIQSETIFWITDVKDLWLKIFSFAYLLQIYKLNYRSSLFFLILAIFSKQVAIVLPVLGFLIIFLNNFNIKQFVKFHAIALVPILWMAYIAIIGQNQQITLSNSYLINKAYLFSDSAGFYIKKLFFPIDLVADYSRTNKFLYIENPILESLIFLLFTFLLLILFIFRKKTKDIKNYLFAGSAILIPLLPILGLIPFTSQIFSNVANRYASISVFGVSLISTLIFRKYGRYTITRFVFVLIISFFVITTYIEKYYWKDNKSFFTETLKRSKKSLIALNNLALLSAENGNYKEAIEYLKITLDENPNFVPALLNLAKLEYKIGNHESAEKILKRANDLPLSQSSNSISYEYAYLLEKLGRIDEATTNYLKAIELNPEDSRAFFRLGTIYIFKKEYKKSAEFLKQAVKINPNNQSYLNALNTVEKIISQ